MNAIKLNNLCFNSIENLKEFIQTNEFDALVKSLMHGSREEIFNISMVADDGLKVYFALKHSYINDYRLITSYETVRHSGSNYSDETKAQTSALAELATLRPLLEEKLLQNDINVNSYLKESVNNDLPF